MSREAAASAPVPVPAPVPAVLAIDPGTSKCGIAVVACPNTGGGDAVDAVDAVPRVLHREVVETAAAAARAAALYATHAPIAAVLIGDATGGASLSRALRTVLPATAALHTVPEAFTSQRARARFLRENPPRSPLHRLLPLGLRTPDRPYDDYVAVLLAEDWLAGQVR